MKQIAEIKRIAKALTASSPEDMSRHLAYRTLKTDIPRLCDALEWAIKHLKNFEGHCNHHALRKIEEILEGK